MQLVLYAGKMKREKIATQPSFNFSLEKRIQYILWEPELFIEPAININMASWLQAISSPNRSMN